jgi:hypothetical protein
VGVWVCGCVLRTALAEGSAPACRVVRMGGVDAPALAAPWAAPATAVDLRFYW